MLLKAFRDSGLIPEPGLDDGVEARQDQFGELEWARLSHRPLQFISQKRTKRLLGIGFAVTDFLVAPAGLCSGERMAICSCGALVNLMVVLCDRLIDAGVPLDCVLPVDEENDASPVTALLREYRVRLSSLKLSLHGRLLMDQVFTRMTDAERRTAQPQAPLAYRFWLRKSALPFVAMALPACFSAGRDGSRPAGAHMRWLYAVGRFFGVVDDAADFNEDLASGAPNYWQRWNDGLHGHIALRVAGWGQKLLAYWDNLVRDTDHQHAVRAIFLHHAWRWLGPA